MSALTDGMSERNFHITVMGRTLEHLGGQMYKRRPVAIAELVANSWDAGARRVDITIPDTKEYDASTSAIVIQDAGCGMGAEQVEHEYLVIGRNRRESGEVEVNSRRVMGRKGIGKLAGFGMAGEMTVLTWRDQKATSLTLKLSDLKRHPGHADEVTIPGEVGPVPGFIGSPSGTRLVLRKLKHKTPIGVQELKESLARRFSRIVLGAMTICINGEEIGEPSIIWESIYPGGEGDIHEYTHTLADGNVVKYSYRFSEDPIRSPQMRGFTILANERTAQAPPYFFDVEGTASGQHATRYLSGTIQGDWLDAGTDDESDVISTDRQELDWEGEQLAPLLIWGKDLTRRLLREWTARKGTQTVALVEMDDKLGPRLARLDLPSQREAKDLLRKLGSAGTAPERTRVLADGVLRAFEYRHFHDVLTQINQVSDEPDQLIRLIDALNEWKVLESRAILEIVKGRLGVIEKFHHMVVTNVPETRSDKSDDNLHDLLGEFPWILNPEWQIFVEEKAVSTILREWAETDAAPGDNHLRIDFLALSANRDLVIIEIKRAGHPVKLEELQRLDKYANQLLAGWETIRMVFISGGNFEVRPQILKSWQDRNDLQLLQWNDIYQKARTFYEHYRAVLEDDVTHRDFATKQQEIMRTRQVLERGTVFRDPAARRRGLGEQDVDYRAEDEG